MNFRVDQNKVAELEVGASLRECITKTDEAPNGFDIYPTMKEAKAYVQRSIRTKVFMLQQAAKELRALTIADLTTNNEDEDSL